MHIPHNDNAFEGSLWIEHLCADCDNPHIMRFGPLDEAGVGFALARDYAAYRRASDTMRGARIVGLGYVGTQVYGLELAMDGDTATFAVSIFDQDATGRLLINASSGTDPFHAFTFAKNHGEYLARADIVVPSDLVRLAAEAQSRVVRGHKHEAAPAPTTIITDDPDKRAMSKDEFDRLMGR